MVSWPPVSVMWRAGVGLWYSGGFKAPQTYRRSVPNDGASPPGHRELQHPGLQLLYLLQYAYWLDRL